MYRCDLCSRVVSVGIPSHRIVVETRPKRYPHRPKAYRLVRRRKSGKAERVFVDDPGGVGREIVREAIVCPECALQRGER